VILHATTAGALACAAIVLSSIVCPPLPARAQAAAGPPPVLLNEIYYDHPGADGGYEFLELFNTADAAVSLAGYSLQAGDGAGPARWRTVWQGQTGDAVAARARFTLGESLVSPPPDRVLDLGLENGPDALRLTAPDGRADVVGYGALTYTEYFAGDPAPDVAAGFSLARSSDGAFTGDNSRDFLTLSPPTPGAANRPERDAELVAGTPLVEPELVEPGEPVAVRAQLVNRGVGPLAAREIRLLLWSAPATPLPPAAGAEEENPDGVLSADSLVAEVLPVDPLEPGDSLAVGFTWAAPAAGAYRLAATARIEDDGVDGNDRLEAFVRAGCGPLVISEVLYAPLPGEPEWVEVRAHGGGPVDLRRFRLADATGRAGAPQASGLAALLEPDSLALLTEDAAALRALRPGLDAFRVLTVSPWPALNNSASGEGASADRVTLRDDRGLVSDAMSYEGGAPSGYSVERRDPERPGRDAQNWGLSALAGGTPLAANSVLAVSMGEAGLVLSPRIWRRGGAGPPRLSIVYRLAWERAVVRLTVIDARGRERARLHDGPSAAAAALEWDGKAADGSDLAPGAYALALDARPAAGGARLRLTRPLVVEP
jgi:hypothetical protein